MHSRLRRRMLQPALRTPPRRGPQVIPARRAASAREPFGDAPPAANPEEVVRGEQREEEGGEVEGEGKGWTRRIRACRYLTRPLAWGTSSKPSAA